MLSAVEKKSDQVYRWLLAYIDENKFSGNQRLPSENALCRKLSVSRETIRVAIDQLVAEGLVYKLKGSGTYFHREKVMTRDLNTDDALYKIGLVLQGQDTSANSGLIEGVRSVLTQEQVDLHVFLTDNKFCNERRCLETVVHQNFHGFIVDGVKSSILSPNLDCYKELYRRKIPVIFYNNFYRNLRCPRVTINDIECAHQLIGRLIDAGHSHIAGIFVYDNYQSVEKFQGMAEAMRNRGLELNDDYIKWCISDEAHNESYVRSIERFLKSIPKCTAIVCCNYIIYRLVMKTLQKMGKTVPEDYSLVCFDYSEETYRQEDVTCSVEQGFEMGRQLALRLMEMISTGECDDRNYTYVMKPILYDGHSIRKLKKVNKDSPGGSTALRENLFTGFVVPENVQQYAGAEAHRQRTAYTLRKSGCFQRHPNLACIRPGRAADKHMLRIPPGVCGPVPEMSGLWENQAHLQRYSGSDFPASTHPEHKSHRDKGFRHLLR